MHAMTDHNVCACQGPNRVTTGYQPGKQTHPDRVIRSTWPVGDDDEGIAEGMCDDDDGAPPCPPLPQIPELQQSYLWDRAITLILASKTRSDAPQR